MTSDSFDAESPVCGKCAVDVVLAEEIARDGVRGVCAFCGQRRKTITLEALAERVDAVYKRDVVRAEERLASENDSDRVHRIEGGDSPVEILQELLGCDNPLDEALRQELAEQNRYSEQQGGENYYDLDQSAYTLGGTRYTNIWYSRWIDFVHDTTHSSRFFNLTAREFLDNLFAPLLRGKFTNNRPPLFHAGVPDSPMPSIVRARDGSDLDTRRKIFTNPARELGAPPPRLRREGRLNAAGIGIFYGCSDIQTAVAEIRLPVGGAAVVAEFQFARPVTLLDLRIVDTPAAILSHFADDYETQSDYLDFVCELHALMARPILPSDQALEYLPTQIIAEYLAAYEDPILDGILLRSAMVSPSHDSQQLATGLNVVLFAHSSVVEGDRNPVTRRVTSLSPSFPADDDYSLDEEVVWTKSRPCKAAPPVDPDAVNEGNEPTLRLLPDGLKVVHVRGITHDLGVKSVRIYDDDEVTDF